MVYGDCSPDIRSGRSNCLITAAPCAPLPPITRIIFFLEMDLRDFKSRKSKHAIENLLTYILLFCILWTMCIYIIAYIGYSIFCLVIENRIKWTSWCIEQNEKEKRKVPCHKHCAAFLFMLSREQCKRYFFFASHCDDTKILYPVEICTELDKVIQDIKSLHHRSFSSFCSTHDGVHFALVIVTMQKIYKMTCHNAYRIVFDSRTINGIFRLSISSNELSNQLTSKIAKLNSFLCSSSNSI